MPFVPKAKLKELLIAGELMSNICFNLGQLEKDVDRKESFQRSQKRWDLARSALHKNNQKQLSSGGDHA